MLTAAARGAVSLKPRAERAAAQSRTRSPSRASDTRASNTRASDTPRSDRFPPMFWPLIGGFIAVVLLTILIGWILDRSQRRHPDVEDGH